MKGKQLAAIAGFGLCLASPMMAMADPSVFVHEEYQSASEAVCTWAQQGANFFDCGQNVISVSDNACSYDLYGPLKNGQTLALLPSSDNGADCLPTSAESFALEVYDVHKTRSNTTASVTNGSFGPMLGGCAPSVTGTLVTTGTLGDANAGGFIVDLKLDVALIPDCDPSAN